jgi:hypothetical protein
MQNDAMRTTIDLDPELAKRVAKVVKALGEKQATVIRMALRQGLPLLTAQQQAPRPDGYFASAYRDDDERFALEDAYARELRQDSET